MLNKVMIIGRLGKDPEIRTTQDNKTVTNFTVATTDRWKDRDGQQQEKTEWHRIVAWGRLGEICGQYLTKGKQVYVEGAIQTRQWEDKDGQTRYTTEIKAFTMQMLGNKDDADTAQPKANQEPYPAAPTTSDDDELPF